MVHVNRQPTEISRTDKSNWYVTTVDKMRYELVKHWTCRCVSQKTPLHGYGCDWRVHGQNCN